MGIVVGGRGEWGFFFFFFGVGLIVCALEMVCFDEL